MKWLRVFSQDARGQAAMTFGFAAIPLLVVIGVAVDYGRQVTARSNLQQAVDATVLAMAHTYLSSASTSATLMGPTQTYLTGAMNSPAPLSSPVVTGSGMTGTPNAATLTNITLSNSNTQMCISATMVIPTTIMAIIRTNYVGVGATACSQAGQTYEVALVLDNSGSMSESAGGQSKMDALIDAAGQLVDILIPASQSAPTTAISITPFSALVNVGNDTSAFFLDKSGQSSIHWQNFHRPSKPWKPSSKFDLFDAMAGNQKWSGCVEDRPDPYITTDTAASSSNADSLFVPFMSPDDPGDVKSDYYNSFCYPSKDSCNYLFVNSYLSDSGSSTSVGNCGASNNYADMDTPSGTQSDGVTNVAPGFGMTMVCKYKGSSVTSQTSIVGLPTGPNLLCTSQKMTPLTTSNSVLKSAVSSMVASGSTNLSTGFMWGWRSISPVVNPFPVTSPQTIGRQNPKPYTGNTPTNNKVIILMTDGYNSWAANGYSPWKSTYEAFGYYANNRLSNYTSATYSATGKTVDCGSTTTSSSFRCQMDAVTLEACRKAKAAPSKVTIYTVGFTVSSNPIDDQGIALLKSCASGSDKYFQASDGTGIVTAFRQIAASIQNLRLAQ